MKSHMGFGAGVAVIFVLVIALLIGLVAFSIYSQVGTHEDVVITIKDKERIQDSNSSKYLIFTEDETFENTDSWLNGKVNSSDIYGDLEPGKTYNCTVFGFRVPLLSWYRNIDSCTLIANPTR